MGMVVFLVDIDTAGGILFEYFVYLPPLHPKHYWDGKLPPTNFFGEPK